LIEDLVSTCRTYGETYGVVWQLAAAPITSEAVEAIAKALADKHLTFGDPPLQLPKASDSVERARGVPKTAFCLQSASQLTIWGLWGAGPCPPQAFVLW
jgi:hypothetical protein